jgi:hypothetical protein
MGRAVLGGRFEGTLKLSANLLIFCEPITVFGHRGLLRDANILRDSVLLRLSTLPERANIHVQSIILHQVWEELQARENLKDKDGRALDPTPSPGSSTSCGRSPRRSRVRTTAKCCGSFARTTARSPRMNVSSIGAIGERDKQSPLSTGRKRCLIIK